MAYKMGLLLSIPFLMMVLLLSADMTDIAIIKNGLDAVALTVGYRIAYEGRLSQETIDFVSSFGADISLETSFTPRIGDTVIFSLSKEYDSLVVSKDPLTIVVKRSTVVGYYDR